MAIITFFTNPTICKLMDGYQQKQPAEASCLCIFAFIRLANELTYILMKVFTYNDL